MDTSALTDEYVDELLAVGRRPQYANVTADVHVVYGSEDWSQTSDRQANEILLSHADFIDLPRAGHFIALERPGVLGALVDLRS